MWSQLTIHTQFMHMILCDHPQGTLNVMWKLTMIPVESSDHSEVATKYSFQVVWNSVILFIPGWISLDNVLGSFLKVLLTHFVSSKEWVAASSYQHVITTL